MVHGGARETEPLLTSSHAVSPPSHGRQTSDAVKPDAVGSDGLASSVWRTPGLLPRLGATMFDFFVTGCSMAALGALIPNIERRYDINDSTTALVFPAGMIGYVAATASVTPITLCLGRRGVAIISPVARILSALLLAAEPAYGVVLVAYVCFGFGTGFTDTAWNTWASGMSSPNVIQGLLHGSFSLGCVAGPIIATQILKEHSWNDFYVFVALLSIIELLSQGWAFRHEGATLQSQQQDEVQTDSYAVKRTPLLRSPAIWICGVFYFVYQGVEQTFTGWIVVFMLRVRDTNSTTAGLASSTFWLGMTVGRYTLGLVTERYGVSLSVSVYITLAFVCQAILNLVTGTSTTILLLGLIGACLAPLFPSGIVLLVSRLDLQDHLRAVALLIALGQIGGALSNLFVGFMADTLGIQHLFEEMCAMTAVMLVTWIVLARTGARAPSAASTE